MAKFEKLARVSNAAIIKNTKRSWDEWVVLLNKAGAKHWTHQETVAFLRKKHKVKAFWQQVVTGGYEIAAGKRVEGQNLKGEFGVTASRTFPLSSGELWELITSSEGLAVWLKPMSDFELVPKQFYEVEGGVFGEVRSAKAPERARLTWQETDWPKATTLNVFIAPRPGKKAVLVFQHDGLKSPRQREELRTLWKARLAELLAVC